MNLLLSCREKKKKKKRQGQIRKGESFEQQGQEEMGLRDSKEDTYASQQCPLTNNRLIMWRRTKNKIKWEQKKAAPASSDATADIS